jgi:hypothetical protein
MLCPNQEKDDLVATKVRERLSVTKREMQKSDMEKFNFKKLQKRVRSGIVGVSGHIPNTKLRMITFIFDK